MSPDQLHVTLTGDRSGRYVVVEERSDGSLVLAPESGARSSDRGGRDQSQTGIAGLIFSSSRSTPTTREVLERWNVRLLDDEPIIEFVMADVDGRSAYVALTSERFIAIASIGRRHIVIQEHPLMALRDVKLVRQRMRQSLCVTWEQSTTVVRASDQETLMRLHQRLAGCGD